MDISQSKRSFEKGEVIMRQGEIGACAYIIEEGLVDIQIERPDGVVQQVATRGPGTIIGEMSIVDDSPRVATIIALEKCKMLEISREDFARRLKTTDPVIQMITQVILTRYRDTLKRAEILGDEGLLPTPEAMEKDFAAQTDVVESIKIANDFKAALENDKLTLHYQPIIDLTKGNVLGFEALMRWPQPEGGFISPGLFIPIAEKSGLIVDASKWAVKQGIRDLKEIEDAVNTKNELFMSINFSSHDFAEHDFLNNILNTAREHDIDPRQLKLEITERLLIQQPDNAKATLSACRKAGVGVAIDDFGTGYSSLSYLYYFPIDVLKIDQSFIRAMYREDRSLELVKSIVGLGKNLELDIVAEGVEDLEEARLLQSMGCDSAQGYYFAKPMPKEDIIDLLSGWEPLRITA